MTFGTQRIMMRRRPAAPCWAITLVAATLALSAVASPASAQSPTDKDPEPAPVESTGLGVRLVGVPAEVDDPRARYYIIDAVPPGETFSRTIEISNNTRANQNVEVYPGAARIADGVFGPEDDGILNELTTWISVDKPEVGLADGERGEVEVTFEVPDDAPPGEQYAVVWAQTSGDVPEGTGTRVVGRVGVRVYLAVGPGNPPAANFEINTITPRRSNTGAPEIVVELSNTGGRAVDISGQLALSDGPGMLSAGPFNAPTTTLMPGTDGSMTFELDPSLPPGPWDAAVSLYSGLIERESTVTLTFPDAGIGTPVSVGDESFPLLVWVLTGSIALAGIAGTVYVVRRRKVPS